MMISVTSSSFRASRQMDVRRDLFWVIQQARELGFEGIEFADLLQDGPLERALALAGRLKDACRAEGLPVVCYQAGGDFVNPRNDDLQQELDHLKAQIRVAAALGSRLMRHQAARGLPSGLAAHADFMVALPTIVRCCRSLATFGEGLGVRTCVENHGMFIQDSDRCETLARQAAHPNFGFLVDAGNFLYADEDPVRALRRLTHLACHFHLKDYHVRSQRWADPGEGFFRSRGGSYIRGAILGHGQVDLPACLHHLRASNYAGFVSIEFEGLEDSLLALRISLSNVRRWLMPPQPPAALRPRGGVWLGTFEGG